MSTGVRDILAWKRRDASKPPPYFKHRSSNTFIITTICFATFTDLFLYGIIVPVIPFALLNRVHIPMEDVQRWVSILLAVYAAALIVCPPIAGWMTDHYKSRRVPFILGLVTLAGATVMLCLGSNLQTLIVGRLLQGASGSVVATIGLALLADTVGHEGIGQAVGWVSLSMSLAILLAPLLGGLVYARAGYYAVYYMAFGLIVIDIALRLLLIEKKVAKQWEISEEQSQGTSEGIPHPESLDTSTTAYSESTTSVNTGSTLAPGKKRFKVPLVLSLLSSYRLLSAIWCTFAISLLLTSWDAVLPLRVFHLFEWGSLGAGLIFLPLLLPSFLAPLVGKYTDLHGPRLPVFIGFVLGTPFVVLLILVDRSGIRQIVLLCALLALLGLAYPLGITAILAEFTYTVNAEEKKRGEGCFGEMGPYAQAYGLFTTAYAGGMMVGPLWAGLVESSVGWTTMCWTLGLLSAVSAVPAGLFTGGMLWKRNQKPDATDVEKNISPASTSRTTMIRNADANNINTARTSRAPTIRAADADSINTARTSRAPTIREEEDFDIPTTTSKPASLSVLDPNQLTEIHTPQSTD